MPRVREGGNRAGAVDDAVERVRANAQGLIKGKKVDDAVRVLDKAIQEHPSDIGLRVDKIGVLKGFSRHAMAFTAASEALSSDTTNGKKKATSDGTSSPSQRTSANAIANTEPSSSPHTAPRRMATRCNRARTGRICC